MKRGAPLACVLLLSACSSVAQVPETASTAPSGGYFPGAASAVPDRAAVQSWREANRSGIGLVMAEVQAISHGEPRPGCIGLNKFACAASIASVLPVGDDYKFSSLFPAPKLDVNGHNLNAGHFELTDVEAPAGQKALKFQLFANKTGRIERVSLPNASRRMRSPAWSVAVLAEPNWSAHFLAQRKRPVREIRSRQKGRSPAPHS